MSNDDFFERVGTEVEARPINDGVGLRFVIADEPRATLPSTFKSGGATTARRWAQADDMFWIASETCETLQPGFYKFDSVPNIGPCLRKSTISTDGLIHLPDTASDRIINEFKTFWGIREKFTTRGFLHKRGILLHGPAGSGKTSALMLMSRDIVEREQGIVVQVENPELAAICLAQIRKIEPERPVVAILEDMDALVQRWGESQFLALLDGETQIDRVCYIATCNYPERLDKRFVDRPSRFDTVEYVGMPTAAARRVYLLAKEPSLLGEELDQWVGRTEGFSIAHLRELIVLVRCFDRPLDAAVARLEKMRVTPPDSERSPDRMPTGFSTRAT